MAIKNDPVDYVLDIIKITVVAILGYIVVKTLLQAL